MKRQFFFLLWLLCTGASFCIGAFSAGAQPVEAVQAVYKPGLKNKTINAETLIANSAMIRGKRLDRQQITSLSVPKIDKSFAPVNRYYLIDTLYQGKGVYVLLLGQWYDFENKAWMASYAPPHRLIQYKQVFYDNAEGFLSMETTIQNDVITITTLNEFETGANRYKKEKYRFASNGQLHKIQ